MDADSWSRLALTLLSSPEKIALGLVVVVGAWRWIRELIREARGTQHEETLVEMLLRENRQQRDELKQSREELKTLRSESLRERRHNDRDEHDE